MPAVPDEWNNSELDELILNAEKNNSGYLEFTQRLLQAELDYGEQSALARRVKVARLPPTSDLGHYDHLVVSGPITTNIRLPKIVSIPTVHIRFIGKGFVIWHLLTTR